MENGIYKGKLSGIASLLWTGLALTLLSLSGCSSDTTKNRSVSLRQEWFPFSGYAGELWAVNESAAKYHLQIKLEPGSDQIDPIKLVLGGKNDFGVVSSDRILQANDKGADLVVIGAVNYISPTCFITSEASGITSFKDIKGKKVGILTGTNTELIYKILKAKNGIRTDQVKEVEIPFDLGTFISGAYDVRPGFVYDEPVSLDRKGFAYHIIKPSDYGVSFVGTVYFTTRTFLNEHPDIVRDFVLAIADGWQHAIKDPATAIHYLMRFDHTIDSTREVTSLKKGLDYFKGEDNRVLFASEKNWQEMAKELKSIGAIQNFDFAKSIENKFVNQVPAK